MTVIENTARRTEQTGEWLAHFVQSTAPDRLNWRPELPGAAPLRTVLELVDECVRVNRFFAGAFRGDNSAESPASIESIAYPGADAACEALVASARELAAALRGLSEEDLAGTVQTHRGALPMEMAIEMPNRNMVYHAGQVNYIQLLAGDPEFHVPTRR